MTTKKRKHDLDLSREIIILLVVAVLAPLMLRRFDAQLESYTNV